jgi:U4/U6 small nuclear ribonucleoprotein PRP31
MHIIAPNVTEIIGPKVTSKLVSAAGGIEELSRIPACNVLVIGSERKALNGLSAAQAGIHRGYLYDLEMVKNAPAKF